MDGEIPDPMELYHKIQNKKHLILYDLPKEFSYVLSP